MQTRTGVHRPPSGDLTQFELPAARAPSGRNASSGTAQLTVLVGPQVGQIFTLVNPMTSLGRATDVDIRLPYTAVSRTHARIHLMEGGRVDLEDLRSSNGTFINGQRLFGRRTLRSGDRVRLGTRLMLQFAVVDHFDRRVRELEKLEVASQLSTAVNHDLNNLMSVLTCGIAYLATLDPARPIGSVEVVECLQDMQLAAKKAGELTHRLHTLVHQPEQRVHEDVDLSELCDEVARMAKRLLPAGVELESHVERGLTTQGNRAWLHQLLMNPCVNSRDAMGETGSLKIEARTASIAELAEHPELVADSYVLIAITDTGRGIAPEILPHVFQPYYTTKGAGRGTGLGLATVARVAREHGGSVHIASKLGTGTRLTIFLPKSTAPATRVAPSLPQPAAQHSAPATTPEPVVPPEPPEPSEASEPPEASESPDATLLHKRLAELSRAVAEAATSRKNTAARTIRADTSREISSPL